MQDALNYARSNHERFVTELMAFLRIPSVSTQPEHARDVRDAAEWLAEAMRQAGIENVQVIDTDRHPLVYGDWLHAGPSAPTVLVYGHYDVQPPDPLELWETPPFEPTIRGDHLHARGAADDKGQAYIHVKVAEAYLAGNGRLPVNIKYIFEGEEESGGRSLEKFVPLNKTLLAADTALVSDTHILGPDQPALVYGLRGIIYMQIYVTGSGHDLHSGSYGGLIDNPLNVLGHIIASLRDREGHILIPGFYDRVRPLSNEERHLLAKRPFDAAGVLAETGAPALWGEPEFSPVERLGARPTLDVHGIIGGYTGHGAKTVLPSTAHAKISMRLVPDQDPREISQLFSNYVRSIAPPTVKILIEGDHGAPATIVNYKLPAVRAAAQAYETVFNASPYFIRGGGSIPVVGLFQEHLELETVLMGFGLPDDRIHSPNERFYLPNFRRGIDTVIHFLAQYASLNRRE